MGSAAFKPPGIQNKIENEIRQKEIDSRENLRIKLDENSKIFDIDRELLGAISKLNRKRTKDDPFDAIMPDLKEQKIQPQQDGLVIILCNDKARKLTIKATLSELFQNAETIRWPDFKLAGDQNSLYFGTRESLCHKVIGYTTFFLFYGVVPDTKLSQSQVEMDINRTVEYFHEYHRGALQDIPKFFIFELPMEMSVHHKMEQDANGTTIFVVSNDKDHLQAISKVAGNGFVPT